MLKRRFWRSICEHYNPLILRRRIGREKKSKANKIKEGNNVKSSSNSIKRRKCLLADISVRQYYSYPQRVGEAMQASAHC